MDGSVSNVLIFRSPIRKDASFFAWKTSQARNASSQAIFPNDLYLYFSFAQKFHNDVNEKLNVFFKFSGSKNCIELVFFKLCLQIDRN